MTDPCVTLSAAGGIAEAVIDNPPVNAASHCVRAGLADAIDRFERDPASQALVIRCAGKTFVAGADIREFGKPMAAPILPDLLARIDACPKPVIAALHGTVLGGGLELALACHYRIAGPGARLGFPEVALGLLPGAGGTQRTPRLAGLDTAIAMITEGVELRAAEANAAGLIDELADGDLAAAARDFAARIVADGKAPRRSSALPMPPDDPARFEAARHKLAARKPGQPAPLLALDAIRLGYEFPFPDALVREHALCIAALATPESRHLRHLFAAERLVARVPGLTADAQVRPIARVGVVGLGTMGRGIVMALAQAGLPVIAVAQSEADAASARSAVEKIWTDAVAKGRLDADQRTARLGAIEWSGRIDALAPVDLVIEAVSEDLAIKRAIFADLGQVTRHGAILASNTSYLDIADLGRAAGRPADTCGMHFFTPAPVMKLLECVRTDATADDVTATIMAFARRIGKLAVLSGVCDGFIVNRLLGKRSREAYFLLEEGAEPRQIDRVLRAFGFPMGPFALADLAGIDVQHAARQARLARLIPRERRTDFIDRMVAAGRLGQKTGAGWYRYGDDRKALDDPATDAIIAAQAADNGLSRHPVEDGAIRDRLLFAMVNEGARLIDEEIVPRPHEIDVAMVNGIGWPAQTGGPMAWADGIGLPIVLAAIEQFRAAHGDDYWTPAPLLVASAAAGRGFYA